MSSVTSLNHLTPMWVVKAAALVGLLLAACGTTKETTPTPQTAITPGVVQASVERNPSPQASAADLAELVRGNTEFALDLYRGIRGREGNLFYSPISISLALAMTYAGARDETERQMANTMHFALPQERLHPALNALDQKLLGPNEADFSLNIVNAVWAQADFEFRQEYLNLVASNYAAGIRTLDFRTDPQMAGQAINQWVAEQTRDRIKDLLPPGLIDDLTRMVLTNAIYFKAEWQLKFPKTATEDRPFTLLSGSTVHVPTMHLRAGLNYASGEGFQAVELPYRGSGVSMIVLLPDSNTLEGFERGVSLERLEGILGAFKVKNIALFLPKVEYEARLDLKQTLTDMGMTDAFLPPPPVNGRAANFTGMREIRDLYIKDVVHKAFVKMDEEGTEAAAATAVVVEVTSYVERLVLRIDRPFLFIIRDNKTGTVLFIGRVLDPRP